MGSVSGFKYILILDVFFLFLCITGILQIKEKARLPFTLEASRNKLVISKVDSQNTLLNEGDIFLSIDNLSFSFPEEVEVIVDGKRRGEQVVIKYIHSGSTLTGNVTLKNYYTAFDVIIYSFSGILFLIIGLLTLIKSSNKKAAHLFYWGCSGAALIIILTPGSYTVLPYNLGFITRFIFHLAYSITPVIFVHFILNFPVERKNNSPFLIKTAYLFSIILSITLTIIFVLGVQNNSIEQVSLYVWIYGNVHRLFIIINFLIAIILFCFSYLKIKTIPDKKKLKWILFGFILGPLSYIVFWVFPYILFDRGLLPEFVVIGLLSAVPLTFAIAIVKYHLFDIDIIINRSVVYLLVISSLIIFYLLLSAAITFSVKGINDTIPALISVSAAALALNPAKKRIQLFVDRKFFRVQYNYREALKNFLDEIDTCLDEITLAEKIVKRINELIPVEKIGFFELQTPGDKIKLIAQSNFDFLQNRVITFKRWELRTALPKPIALESLVEEGVDIEIADSKVFNRWRMALVFPFKSTNNEIFGFLVLGKKKSGFRFTVEDIDLINAVSSKVATTMERNKYQKELFIEHLEKERLEELNKMKSFIVSRVSHDFRDPLFSISMFTDLLLSNKDYSKEKVYEYIKLINSQSNRLRSMAENVLDFSKIEKGSFEYHFEEIYLNEVVETVFKSMQYQLELNKFKTEINLSDEELKICADSIGIEAVLVNLISNAIKYSANKKSILLTTGRIDKNVFVSVKDEGIGISNNDLENIFHPFLRGHNIDPKKIKGAGLGLSIVKHIMDAHKGKIEVESEINKGSCFKLIFPQE